MAFRVVAGAAAARAVPSGDRLGTPGIALMIVGLFLMYWGFGIFRGETNKPTDMSTPGFGGGKADQSPIERGGGGSGSF